MSVYEHVDTFSALFSGLHTAFGTGAGRWVKRPPTRLDFIRHLQGDGPGIGIAPLRPDNTVTFAAIDLDEPDFEAARAMQEFLPGTTFLERSRSGNAHVWVFFSDPIAAWIPMGVLREACTFAGKQHVEVFPKNHDFSTVRLGNYINLPFHGKQRPVLSDDGEYTLEQFLDKAEAEKNNPAKWQRRADRLLINEPDKRERSAEFGSQKRLHVCAEHVLSGEAGPVVKGHRAVVYFCLAKQLTNWQLCDHDEALEMLRELNASSPDPISDYELKRILGNAERGEYTSTGCDDPLFQPYAHPDCPIANG
jgi:hypothetical protein